MSEGSQVYLPFRDEENSLKLELTFDGEMLNCEMLFPIVCQALVKCTILFGGDFLRVPRPDGLCLVELLVFNGDFLDLLRLLRFVLVVDLLNLGLLLVIFLGLFALFDLLKNWLARPMQSNISLLTFSISFVTVS